MKAVWQLGDCTSREIYQVLHRQHGWANTTVKTLLSKLVQKDFLSVTEDGKRYIYHAKQSSLALMTRAADAFLEKSMEGQMGQLLCYMANRVDLSQSDIRELETILAHYKQNKG